MNPTSLQVTYAPTTLLVPAGLLLSLALTQTTISVPTAQGALSLPVVMQSVTLQQGTSLTVSPVTTTLMFTQQAGVQGPPGPRQIHNGGSEPNVIAGYTVLWFKTPVPPTGDPNDRDVSLIE